MSGRSQSGAETQHHVRLVISCLFFNNLKSKVSAICYNHIKAPRFPLLQRDFFHFFLYCHQWPMLFNPIRFYFSIYCCCSTTSGHLEYLAPHLIASPFSTYNKSIASSCPDRYPSQPAVGSSSPSGCNNTRFRIAKIPLLRQIPMLTLRCGKSPKPRWAAALWLADRLIVLTSNRTFHLIKWLVPRMQRISKTVNGHICKYAPFFFSFLQHPDLHSSRARECDKWRRDEAAAAAVSDRKVMDS